MATTAEQLASVQAAIAAVQVNGQSVRYGERQVTFADHKELCEREESLRSRMAAEQAAARKRRNRISYMVPD